VNLSDNAVVENEITRVGLDPAVFLSAPPSVAHETLAWIRLHGGIEKYLDKIGFDSVWRAKLRSTLIDQRELSQAKQAGAVPEEVKSAEPVEVVPVETPAQTEQKVHEILEKNEQELQEGEENTVLPLAPAAPIDSEPES